MRVLFLSQFVPYPPYGGALQRGYNLIRELHKYNKIYLMAFNHPDILGTDALISESQRELKKFCEKIYYFPIWTKKSILHKYTGHFLSLFDHRPFNVIAYKSNSFKERFLEILKKERIDLVHFDTVGLARFNSNELRIPKVLTHHNIESELMGRRANIQRSRLVKYYLSQQAKKLRDYEKINCPNFNCNITVSDNDAEELNRMIPGINYSTIPNGVDTEYFASKRNVDEQMNSLIYAGGMNSYANADAVLYFLREIWSSIKARFPKIKFYAVGQDPPSELIMMKNQDRNIKVTGFVDDIRPYVSKASVYVVPLRVGGGTKLKVLDAMALSKAIVSTSVGCEGIDVTPNKNILVADDPDDFADKTCALLADSQRRAVLGREARKLVENKYSWEIIGKKLQKTYEETMGEMEI